MDGEGDRLIVRTLRPEDLLRLVAMDRELTGRSRTTWYEGKLKRALDESDVRISLGAEREDLDGLLVGAVLGSLHYGEFGLPEPMAVLDTILVDRRFGRQGVASRLLEQLVKNLRALGIDRLRTEVAWDEHELVHFLADRGFAPLPRLVLELNVSEAELDAKEETGAG